MKISGSTIAMSSRRSFTKATASKFVSFSQLKEDAAKINVNDSKQSIFEQLMTAKGLEEQKASEGTKASATINRPSYNNMGMKEVNSVKELKLLLLDSIISAFEKRRSSHGNHNNLSQNFEMPEASFGDITIATPTQYTMQMVTSEFYSEEETTAFCGVGSVHTEDGRDIDLNVTFEMSRSYQETRESYLSFDYVMCDPLVINFKGNSADLTDQKFMFDIDGDGKQDEISQLGSGSGFLALDKNEDGKINNGTELFGTASGNGFKDLAQYDEDHNGWIDENDSIFDKLKVWTKDEDGNDTVISIKEAGLGAICLTNANTQFSLNNTYDNQTNGIIQNSGIYLNEDGSAGTIQHVDFAV